MMIRWTVENVLIQRGLRGVRLSTLVDGGREDRIDVERRGRSEEAERKKH